MYELLLCVGWAVGGFLLCFFPCRTIVRNYQRWYYEREARIDNERADASRQYQLSQAEVVSCRKCIRELEDKMRESAHRYKSFIDGLVNKGN